jgi:hypothetical protein
MQLKKFFELDEFLKEIEASVDDISEAMRTAPGRVAFYGAQYVQAQKQAKKVALTVAQIEGRLTQEHRKLLDAAAREEVEGTNKSPTRVTAEMVKAAVATDTRYIAAQNVKIDADEIEGICRVANDAFKARRDLLSSGAYLKGAELKSGTIIQGAREATERYHARRADRDPAYQPPASTA